MTSTKTTTTPAAVDTEESATRVGPMHQAFADFLNTQHGAGITAQQIFLVTSKRKAFRSTDTYRVEVKAAQEQAKAAELSAKEQRAAERQRKAEEKAAAAATKKAENEAAAKATEAPVEKKAPAAKAPAAKPATKKATATKATPAKTA